VRAVTRLVMPFRTHAAARAGLAALAALLILLPAVAAPVLAVDATVRIRDGVLDPMRLVVAPGTTVTWVNDAGDRHRMRSQSGPTEFDSGNLEPGESFSVMFTREGTWSYLDERDDDDSSYWGTVVVREGAPSGDGGSGGGGGTNPAPAPEAITMADRAFRPRSITVDAGATVRWRNDDDREHTVTSTDRAFDSGVLNPGQAFSTTLATAGTYSYLCAIHPEMTGSITVRGDSGGGSGGGAAPTPKPSPKPTPTPPPAPGAEAVTVVDFDFRPGTVDVPAGATVVWSNDGVAPHTVTATDGSWDSGMVAPGDAFRRRFDAPGTYEYLCAFHPDMTGTVRVSGSSQAAPQPATPSPASASPSAGASASQPPASSASTSPDPAPTDDVAAAAPAVGAGSGSGGSPASRVDAPGVSDATGESMLRFALVAVLCAGAILAFAKLLGSSLRRA
jgi:plastocyanin